MHEKLTRFDPDGISSSARRMGAYNGVTCDMPKSSINFLKKGTGINPPKNTTIRKLGPHLVVPIVGFFFFYKAEVVAICRN